MSRIKKLYESMILEHNKNPRNFKKMEAFTYCSHGLNPLCGDDYFIYVKTHNGILEDVSFNGHGCAISKSSGSLMTEILKGKSIQECEGLKDLFLKLISTSINEEEKKQLGKLTVFDGVKQFPVRVKCAALVWRALEQALIQGDELVKTE